MGTGGARGLFCLLMLGWFWSMAMPAVAQTNAISHSPAKVVEKYFALDNKGVRLDATSFESVASLVEWKEEPAWGKVIVISGFTVPDDFRQWEIVNRLEVVVPVEFRVLGVMYLDTAGFVPEPGTEQVRVRVKVQGGAVENRGAARAASCGAETNAEFCPAGLVGRNRQREAGVVDSLAGRVAKGERMTKKTEVDLLIFDLDGTLIESKWDIADSVNLTLRDLGVPERPQEEIFGFVGDGVKKLLRLAVGEGNQDLYDEALRVFRGHYLAHCLDRTMFYPGINEVLMHFSPNRRPSPPIRQSNTRTSF